MRLPSGTDLTIEILPAEVKSEIDSKDFRLADDEVSNTAAIEKQDAAIASWLVDVSVSLVKQSRNYAEALLALKQCSTSMKDRRDLLRMSYGSNQKKGNSKVFEVL